MQSRRIELEIPSRIAGYVPMDDESIKNHIEKLLLADLVRRGIVSHGRAAELAGKDKMTFIVELGEMGIPYYDGSIAEILADADTVRQTMIGRA